MTPRASDPVTATPAGTLVLLTRGGPVPLDRDPLAPIHRHIEQFNRDNVLHGPHTKPEPSQMLRLKEVAEHAATHYQKYYNRALTGIFFGAGIAASALVLGHTFGRNAPYLTYSVLVIASFIVYLVVSRQNWKDRFIEYRALEFGLFVQYHWDLAGVDRSVANVYLRLQRSDIDWIREAIRTVHHLDPPVRALQPEAAIASVRTFVTDQRTFFQRASRRDRRLCSRYELISWGFFWIGVAFTVLLSCAAIYHLAVPHHEEGAFVFWRWDNDTLIVFGIALATIWSAVFHEYPTRRAYHAQARRYETMFSLYDRALHVLDAAQSAPLAEQVANAQEVVQELGTEALAENGDWVMLHRELPIEVLRV